MKFSPIIVSLLSVIVAVVAIGRGGRVPNACEERDALDCCDPRRGAPCSICPKSSGDRELEEKEEDRELWGKRGGGGFKNTCNFKCVSSLGDLNCAVCPVGKFFYRFTPGPLEDVSESPERLQDIVRDLDGNMDGTFALTDEVITLSECGILRDYADSQLEKAIHDLQGSDKEKEDDLKEDFRVELSPAELEMLISVESIQAIFESYTSYSDKFPVSGIALRRTSLTGNKHIQYHNDGDNAVMHVWLNEDDVEGGNLVYLNRDGASKVDDIRPGVAALHGNRIVHGVTPVNGTRYILVLLGDCKTEDAVGPMVA